MYDGCIDCGCTFDVGRFPGCPGCGGPLELCDDDEIEIEEECDHAFVYSDEAGGYVCQRCDVLVSDPSLTDEYSRYEADDDE